MYLFQDSQNSQPSEAFHGIDLLVCSVPDTAKPDGEAEAVRLHREGLSPELTIGEGHFTLEGDGGCYVDRDELIASIRRAIEWADGQE